jgi:hypothetical protein
LTIKLGWIFSRVLSMFFADFARYKLYKPSIHMGCPWMSHMWSRCSHVFPPQIVRSAGTRPGR